MTTWPTTDRSSPSADGDALQAPPGARRRPGLRSGFLALEVVLVTLVLIVALQIFAQIMLATSRQRSINRENATAMEAARSMIEHLKSLPVDQVFLLYNDDPADDPAGPGTAPGQRFVVDGLTPVAGAVDGAHAELRFPVDPLVPGSLREDLDERGMGMPRDLNGDGQIDGENHAQDYTILPLELVIAWRGRSRDRSLSQFVILTEMRK